MSWSDEYFKLVNQKKKKKDEEEEQVTDSFTRIANMKANVRANPDIYHKAIQGGSAQHKEKQAQKEAEENKGWFKKGAFKDGYQFGDVTKTILGSTTDLGENIGSGIIGMGEKVLDAMAWIGNANAKGQYYANGGGYNIEQDKLFEEQHKIATKATEEFIKKDLYDERAVAKAIITNPAEKLYGFDTEKASVFADKSDALAESAGQLLATAGMQAVGIPWWATTGMTTFGAETENALNLGADFSEAGLSGAISAGAEILTEKLSGGIKFGGKTLSDALVDPFVKGISNKTVRMLVNMGADAAGEGLEEIASGYLSAIGQKLTYMDDKELEELFTSEDAIDSFLGGAILGGGGNIVQGIQAKAQGVDAVTGLNKTEQAVFDKLYKEATEGKSQREKVKIYDELMDQMEKGYISTDTIEDILGDKSSFDALSKEAEEYNTLYNTASGQLSKAQMDRLSELEAKNKENPYKDLLESEKGKLSQSVFEMVKGTRLSESYNERARRGQAFEADLSQYDTKQQATIQKAIDSGILNNTRRTHEFVDMVAKITADKGVLFDFTTNERLKESGFAVDGKFVNGYFDKPSNTIGVNINSSKALNSVVGHEITHVLEGTEVYKALKQTLFDYAKAKGDYQGRYDALSKMYENIKNADVEAELTADLVGDYLFTDSDFINRLSTENRNVFQKIFDEIKYLCKVATAGSKEARELEKVKRDFEKAYRESGKTEGTKYSISESDTAYMDAVNRGDTETAQKMVDEAAKKAGYDVKAYHGTGFDFTVFDKAKQGSNYGDWGRLGKGFYFAPDEKGAKVWAEQSRGGKAKIMPVYLKGDKMLDAYGALPDDLKDTIPKDWDSLMVRLAEKYASNYIEYLQEFGYDVQEILTSKGYDGLKAYDTEYVVFDPEQVKSADVATYDDDGNVIPLSERFNAKNEDIRYSLSDSDGKKLTEEQAEFFKDSKVRDEKGNLKVMYHGTSKGGFTVFDTYKSKYGLFGTGFYFTDSENIGESYTKKGKGNNPQVYKAYLNIKNPLDMDAPAEPAEWSKAFDEVDFPESGTNEDFYRALEEYYEDQQIAKWEVEDIIRESIEYGMGYDGITHIGGGRVNADGERHRVYIAFDPEQIKNVDNVKPTDDPDIRYSLSEEKALYTGSPNTNIQRFKAGGVDGSRQSGDRYGRGVYLTTNESTAKGYAGDNGRVYKINADGLNIFNLNDTITPEMQESLRSAFNSSDKQFRNSVLRSFRTEKIFDDFESAEKFFDEQSIVWKEQDGYYSANKPDILSADETTGKVVIEFTDFENWENAIGNLTGNHLYDALKSISTDDFSSFITGHGFDGIAFDEDSDNQQYVVYRNEDKLRIDDGEVTDTQNENGLDRKSEVKFSLSNDTAYMDKAISMNNSSLLVDSNVMAETKALRERIAARMNEIKDRGLVGLPEDIEGNTYIANSSYDGTEENTTICPRSLASEAFVDAVSEYLGRPLTVEEQIYISQDLQGRSLTPECTYCYVATDRKAYRAFLGEYINQRDSVLQKLESDPNADVSRNGELYKQFLNGRKDTNPMYKRFKMWVDAYKNGTPMVDASHLANINKLMGDINSEFGEALKPQIVDAMKYAQSASWAKKRINYVAYNGHILNWKQDRINKLNSHYGLRMYSFSDFHPAFVLENMQMITDASVRGLKMLGYTKDTDFVEIFAPSGMNINVSTFGFESGGNVYENNIIGAEWAKAQELRAQYPNVGITFVATNDTLVNWALEQDWIDVVIPYHLVRTGAEVAKAFGYTNYTSESADTKTKDWKKGDQKSIAPTEHNNDKVTYLNSLAKNHLNPRFARFQDHPNYMKLVNECRQSASESKPVQPVFNEDAAMKALAKLEANGYYQPIGGSVDRMYEIAAEVAEDMTKQIAPAMSLSEIGEQPKRYGNYNIYGKDIGLNDPMEEFAPVKETVSETESVEGVAENATTTEAPTEDWREAFESLTDADAPPVRDNSRPKEISTVAERIKQKIINAQKELDKNRQLRDQSYKDYDEEIASLQAKYDAKKNKNTQVAQGILRSIERLKRLQADSNANYSKRISDLEKRVEKLHSQEYSRAEHRRDKQEGYAKMWEEMIGDTSTWKDMALGLQYKTKTLRRILRKVVKDANGNADFKKADRIYDELETKYDHNEALLKKESQKLKDVFQKLKLNHTEDTYAQMLGELRHNPDTSLSEEIVKEYYNKNKGKIDTKKVDKAIAESRKLYDDLIERVNKVLKEQGFKEIPYRQGYFPHFTNPKQNWLQKALNWKPVDNEIPTSIAGLTETFKPQRSWQKFDKQRHGDTTDYSLYQGLDTYIHGALDWIYHIEDLQKRRALENYLRYTHSDEGIQARIEEIKNSDMDADEAQQMIDAVLKEGKNPLGGLVRELMNRTNTLANKKAAADRAMEDDMNRKIYSTMTNLNNRINANMVVGSFSSALTNFIPMVQSWHQVSPYYTVRGLGDFVRSTVHDDGTVAKSDFLTNRLVQEEKLYQTGWDKVTDKAAIMMNVFDNITAQTVWRSKYLQNLHEGMSESDAIKDADQFAKNVMAGRSRGNQPTIFDAKNPVTKLFTAFQLEVANQYGYMFEDVPQDTKSDLRLAKGYATAFLGAYLYNALYSSLVGRDAAFDPISILQDLLGDLEDEEEPEDIILNLGENILEEVPFIGGLLGGGRVPMSSALPYSNDSTPFASMLTDLSEGNMASLGKELLKPLYYLAMPVGGGQIKKTVEGLGMFLGDHPISGSYTDSGALRYPVAPTFGNVLQAGLFGQYASKNARDYFDNDFAPLKEKQIEEFVELDIPIKDYRKIREDLAKLSTLGEKAVYIANLDLTMDQKNLLINNIANRDEPIDLTGMVEYGDFGEFEYAKKYPDKYKFLQANGVSYDDYQAFDEDTKSAWSWAYQNPEGFAVSKAIASDVTQYKQYTKALSKLTADKDEDGKSISGSRKEKVIDYINSLDADYGEKIILFKSEYPADDTYNQEIIDYLNERDDISPEEMKTILLELGFQVDEEGYITWD